MAEIWSILITLVLLIAVIAPLVYLPKIRKPFLLIVLPFVGFPLYYPRTRKPLLVLGLAGAATIAIAVWRLGKPLDPEVVQKSEWEIVPDPPAKGLGKLTPEEVASAVEIKPDPGSVVLPPGHLTDDEVAALTDYQSHKYLAKDLTNTMAKACKYNPLDPQTNQVITWAEYAKRYEMVKPAAVFVPDAVLKVKGQVTGAAYQTGFDPDAFLESTGDRRRVPAKCPAKWKLAIFGNPNTK